MKLLQVRRQRYNFRLCVVHWRCACAQCNSPSVVCRISANPCKAQDNYTATQYNITQLQLQQQQVTMWLLFGFDNIYSGRLFCNVHYWSGVAACRVLLLARTGIGNSLQLLMLIQMLPFMYHHLIILLCLRLLPLLLLILLQHPLLLLLHHCCCCRIGTCGDRVDSICWTLLSSSASEAGGKWTNNNSNDNNKGNSNINYNNNWIAFDNIPANEATKSGMLFLA